MDIAACLDGLGLGQYGQAFRDNEVDERVLPSLTAEDLKDLGVMLVGHSPTIARWHRRAWNLGACCGGNRGDRRRGASERRRTPPAHSDVLRPRGLDTAVVGAR